MPAGGGPVSPAVQMRTLLEKGRELGFEFDQAWAFAWERIKWPHDTTHRREWKAMLGDLDACEETNYRKRDARRNVEAWRAAYERAQPDRKTETLGRLAMAA